MKVSILLSSGLVAVAVAIAGAQTPAPVGTTGQPSPTASGSFMDAEGRTIGQVRLQQTPRGVLLKIDLTSATPGIHAIHMHKVGRCDTPSFDSAGDHLDTAAHKHGFLNPAGQHTGDLPNLDVPSTSKLSVEYALDGVTVEPGPRSLLDADGSALVIHAGKDDYVSDPAGQSGDRLACARITADRR